MSEAPDYAYEYVRKILYEMNVDEAASFLYDLLSEAYDRGVSNEPRYDR